jgi:hypothetical protein
MAAVQPDFGAVGKLDIDVEARGAVRWIGGCSGHEHCLAPGLVLVMLNLFQHLLQKNAHVRGRS